MASFDRQPIEEPQAQLERALIDDYLSARGLTAAALRARDDAQSHALLREASTYASTRLSEMEARAHYVHEIHARD